MMKIEQAFTFDDLVLVPRHSSVRSRKDPNTSTMLGLQGLAVPVVASPMNTVSEVDMAIAMSELGAGVVIHRYMSIERQCQIFLDSLLPCDGYRYEPWVAIGASGDYFERAKALSDVGVRQFCVDVANGHSEVCLDAVHNLRKAFAGYDLYSIMAGNVCTAEGAVNLEAAGADVIRVGIGAGSACITRTVTGFGIPQLSAISECSEAVQNSRTSIVSDGGIRSSGDVVKALAMGADAVMIGGLLAGTDQTPGRTFQDPDTKQLFKFYHGMASEEGRKEYFSENEEISFVPEGDSHKVWHKGDAKKIVASLNDSLKVGMSFAGAMSIKELQESAEWRLVTHNGSTEGNSNRRMYK